MDAMEAILTRRSKRTFTDEPVTQQQIEAIIKAGMYAPSSTNIRNWEFLTITDPVKLAAMADLCRHWKPLTGAAVGVVCCVDDSRLDDTRREFGTQNGAAATQNMLLAAHALGLGGVWLNNGLDRPQHGPSKALLGIPEHLHVVSVLAIGHPAGDPPQQPQRFEPEKWHKEVW